jgi:hypothetical protein
MEIGLNVASNTGLFPLMGVFTASQSNTGLPVSLATANLTLSTGTASSSQLQRVPAIRLMSQFA